MPIPKIIHYAWFSDQPMDEIYKTCLQSWSDILPAYQLNLWDSTQVIESRFFNKMMRQKKWAFAADYIRLYALYNYGGIYLDLDVRVVKSFDPLLQHDCLLGLEDAGSLACHMNAARKGHPFIKKCLDFYDNALRLKISPPPTMPRIVNKIACRFGLQKKDTLQNLPDNITVYPAEYFTPFHYHQLPDNPDQYITAKSYCIHYWQHSWSWLDKNLLIHLQNQPWLFMNMNDWKRFFKNAKKRIL